MDAESNDRVSKVHCGIFMVTRCVFDDCLLQCARYACGVIKSKVRIYVQKTGRLWQMTYAGANDDVFVKKVMMLCD